MGSAASTTIHGPVECDMRISYEEPDTNIPAPPVDALSATEMNRVKEEIRQTFIGK